MLTRLIALLSMVELMNGLTSNCVTSPEILNKLSLQYFWYDKCSGYLFITFPTYTYDENTCVPPEPDPNLYLNSGSKYARDCTSDSYDEATRTWPCTFEINTEMDWVATDGYSARVDTTSSSIVQNYGYLWQARYRNEYSNYDTD